MIAQRTQKAVGFFEGLFAAIFGGGWFTYQWWTDTLSILSMLSGLVLTWLGIWLMVKKLKNHSSGD